VFSLTLCSADLLLIREIGETDDANQDLALSNGLEDDHGFD